MRRRYKTVLLVALVLIIALGGYRVYSNIKNDDRKHEEVNNSTVLKEIEEYISKNTITEKQKAYGLWVNRKKYMSLDDLKNNLASSTVLTFGSSEFNHGLETPYHPSNLFKNQNVNLMLIGDAYNQSLSLATYMGGLLPKVENKKVVLFLSPSWFYKKGISKANYSKKFSEGAYIAFMESSSVTQEQKEYLAKRTDKLLIYGELREAVDLYNKVLLYKTATSDEKKHFEERKKLVADFTHEEVLTQMEKSGLTNISEDRIDYSNAKEPDWDGLVKQAISEDEDSRNNEYYIDDTRWNQKYAAQVPGNIGSQNNSSFEKSPEYDDLKFFLDICKENNIESLLICQPQNGYWYDDTGLTKDKRDVFYEKINEIAGQYNCKVTTYQDKEYEKYFLLDTVHLAGEGWTLINKDIYNFINNN